MVDGMSKEMLVCELEKDWLESENVLRNFLSSFINSDYTLTEEIRLLISDIKSLSSVVNSIDFSTSSESLLTLWSLLGLPNVCTDI